MDESGDKPSLFQNSSDEKPKNQKSLDENANIVENEPDGWNDDSILNLNSDLLSKTSDMESDVSSTLNISEPSDNVKEPSKNTLDFTNNTTVVYSQSSVDEIVSPNINICVKVTVTTNKNIKEDSLVHVTEQTPRIFRKLANRTCFGEIEVPINLNTDNYGIDNGPDGLILTANTDRARLSEPENSREDFVVDRICSIANDIVPFFEHRLNNIVENIVDDPWDLFQSVAKRIISNPRQITWGQIIVLLYFGISLVKRFYDMNHQNIFNRILSYIMSYFSCNDIFNWIARNGGWNVLENVYQNYEYFNLRNISILCSMLLAGAIVYKYLKK